MSNHHNASSLASILSLSAVSGVSTIVTGITPQLHQQFSSVPTTVIEWTVTVANLSALLTLMVNPFLTTKFGVRRVVISGLLVSGIFGAMPAFITNFYFLFICRVLLGLGIGLFSPHAISMIAHVYNGDFRARLLGYQTGISALGNAVLLAIAGLVITISWHAVFAIYMLLVPIALLAFRYLPNVASGERQKNQPKDKLPRLQLGLCILAFFTYLIIWGVQLKIPVLFSAQHIGTAAVANWTLSAMNIGGLVAGLTFGRLHKRFAGFTLSIGYFGAGLSVLAMVLFQSPVIVIMAAVFFNFIYSYTGPYIVYRSNLGLSDQLINQVSSYLTIATIISAFFAPVVWNWIGRFGPGDLADNVLVWIALLLVLIAIGSTVFARRERGVKN
ncbi:MFS transporter [Lacticaseibacillus jixianensis]|uniref:MFS transporter n=1 Tax=Lacticaseibacillus jixianensis TaxID=2486012 RepID=A0ABW4BAI3_9LACO|nr:MFS transporter [Lacticaseibacillus jixianensis]